MWRYLIAVLMLFRAVTCQIPTFNVPSVPVLGFCIVVCSQSVPPFFFFLCLSSWLFSRCSQAVSWCLGSNSFRQSKQFVLRISNTFRHGAKFLSINSKPSNRLSLPACHGTSGFSSTRETHSTHLTIQKRS